MKQSIKHRIKETHNIEEEKPIYTLIFDMNSVMKMSLSADKRVGTNHLSYGMVFQTLIQFKKMLGYKNFDYVYGLYDGEQSGILRYKIYQPYKANRDKNYGSNLTDYDRSMNAFVRKVISYSNEKRKSLKDTENKSYYETDDESFERQRYILSVILENLFIRQVICDEVEGDDLIAYYVKNKKPNEKIVIYSGDRDLTQLIADDITVYVPQLKRFITPKNHIDLIGFHHENVVLKKILCGDSSDNIKGIKSLGEPTLLKYFPKIKTEKVTLEEVIEGSKLINEERVKEKKKPLQALSNIVNAVTDGEQGNKIYEINRKLISLDEPLNIDYDGNELLLSDIIGTDEDLVKNELEQNDQKAMFYEAFKDLSKREKEILMFRYGLMNYDELTQKDVAKMMGISQSYISRLEKKIIKKLRNKLNYNEIK